MTDARLQSKPLASRAGNGSMGQMGCRNLTVDVTWVMVKCSMGRVGRRLLGMTISCRGQWWRDYFVHLLTYYKRL